MVARSAELSQAKSGLGALEAELKQVREASEAKLEETVGKEHRRAEEADRRATECVAALEATLAAQVNETENKAAGAKEWACQCVDPTTTTVYFLLAPALVLPYSRSGTGRLG